jgi:exodeoxyribonuclease VII small subunit
MSDAATSVKEVTFEGGYDRLKEIVARLDDENVSVDEMCALFAEGKGLEKELRAYLEQQQGRLDEIEGGENLPQFRIVAPSRPTDQAPAPAPAADGDDAGGDDLDWEADETPAGPGDFQPAPSGAADDDIPF